jgi:hypothetical protein
MTTSNQISVHDRALIPGAIARLRASVMAVSFGLTGGIGLWVATAWLLIRGGENAGYHLGLLSNYFPGYRVSWPGSLLGFVYGALLGALIGWSVAWVYNAVANLRGSKNP